MDEVAEMCSESRVWDAEVGLVAGGFVTDVAFADVISKESYEFRSEGDIGCDDVVVTSYAESRGGWDVVPVEDTFLFKDFKMS